MLREIRSGGQTGVDRAALEAARALCLPYSGWCPRGGWSEDLPDPPGLLQRYPLLRETPSTDPAQRTAWNVRDSDATLVLIDGTGASLSPGTLLTVNTAHMLGKPCLTVSLDEPQDACEVAALIQANLGCTAVLNVAGPRESESPGIQAKALALLLGVLPQLHGDEGASGQHTSLDRATM